MIAASDPLEFIPHGRTVMSKHPTQIYMCGKQNPSSEHSLLYKLANVGISDDTIQEAREEQETEWWNVREVFYRKSDEFNDEDNLHLPKDNKNEFSDSFRGRMKNEFNISIRSEITSAVKRMDQDGGNSGQSQGGSANSSINMSKKFNLNTSQGKTYSKTKTRPMNTKTDCCYEEELYVKGHTAVWSKGQISSPATRNTSPEHRDTISCYTSEHPIKHALFCDFHINFNNTMLIDALNSQIGDEKKNIKIEDTTEYMNTKVISCVLIIDKKSIKAYTNDGREYLANVPFQVKKVWTVKYGVLLEKDATPLLHNSLLPSSFLRFNDSQNASFSKSKSQMPQNMSAKLRAESICGYDQDVPLPTCFSLTHPLDEVTPLVMKSPHGLQYYNDGDLQIMFTSSKPSIVLVYDWKLGTHSIWKLRRTTRDECLTMCPNADASTTITSQCDLGTSQSFMNRHTTSWITGVGSPFTSKRGPSTPSSKSRLDSPMAHVFHQQGMSPHASMLHTSMSMLANNTAIQQPPPSLPLYPNLCLDHIWTESPGKRRDTIENPNETKSFLHTDLVGHDYLCYMVKSCDSSFLQMVRLQKSNCHGKENVIVGVVNSVAAKDAVALENLKMFALIDELGNIILQSGNHVVGKVHVGGVLARLIDSPYTKRSAFASPFPRRSSLLPSRVNETAVFDDSVLHLLSPVPHSSAARTEQKEALGLQSLCDAVGNRMTLVFDKGLMYRIRLPVMACSNLVSRCCHALKAILPKDISIQILIKWYGVRNAPGTQDLTPEQEWSMFANVLYSLTGYDLERLDPKRSEDDIEIASKKQRTSSDGSTDDWEYLLNTKLHKTMGRSLADLLNLNEFVTSKGGSHNKLNINAKRALLEMEKCVQFNYQSLLYPHVLQILFSLHLVYEETKLNTLLNHELQYLAPFLYQLSKDMRLDNYVNHYWLDFPAGLSLEYDSADSQISESHLKCINQPTYFTSDPPNVLKYIDCILREIDLGTYPYLSDVNKMSRNIIEVLSIMSPGAGCVQTICHREGMSGSSTPRPPRPAHSCGPGAAHFDAVFLLCERGVTPHDIESLPPSLSLMMYGIFAKCKSDPPVEWPAEAYKLIMREDLAVQTELSDRISDNTDYMEVLALELLEKETAYSQCSRSETDLINFDVSEIKTGMEHLDTKILKLLYPKDLRMAEVISLLQSSIPVTINLTQRPEVSDHDFIEEQEKYLYAICTRTMALPIARGMLTLRTLPCVPSEPLCLPKVCVSGRGPPPRCNTIELSTSGDARDSPPHCLIWPNFHNGVAGGLALVPMTGSSIDASWVIYNKPKGATDMSTEHAGFLMAVGLNGHLKDMPFMNIYEYLVKCQEMTSVGLLLGLAATYRGTMNVQATKMMSIHLEPLLPPTSIELDIPQNILVAALLGVGLLYQNTMHTHYAHILLNEIGKPPGPEMENCVEREGYALAAGLALGMVVVGAHDTAPAHLPHRLRRYMLGGDKDPIPGSQKDKYKQGSFAVREGTTVNLDVTSPGATLALGLLYLRSNNTAVAAWLEPPSTSYLLDDVRPDLLMLRIIARGLILWDAIEPSATWVECQVPESIKPYVFVKPVEENIDYEAMSQAYCNIIAGACFSIGLRFAGSGDDDATEAVLHYVWLFTDLGLKNIIEMAGRPTVESCLNIILISAAMVQSGRGDIDVLRAIRRLRARVPVAPTSTQPALTHGGQMAVHMSLGLLFVGGGRCTLSTSSTAVAALVTAFFPKFPAHSEDNRYHLQAFRHLYVLAVEPRLVMPRDIDNGKLCYAHLQVVKLDGAVAELKAPCILPELNTLREVRVKDPRYWPVLFQRDRNWDQLEKILEFSWCVDIKQKAGCLSYLDDPEGSLTLVANALTIDRANVWSATSENIELFTSDERVRNFTEHYLATKKSEQRICSDCSYLLQKKRNRRVAGVVVRECQCRKYNNAELELMQGLSMVTYQCVVKDILCALPIWVTFLKIINEIKSEPSPFHTWQIKLLQSYVDNHNKKLLTDMAVDNDSLVNEPLLPCEFTLAINQKFQEILDSWEHKMTPLLRKYLGLPSNKKINSSEDVMKKFLSAFVTFYDLPKSAFQNIENGNPLFVLMKLQNMNLGSNTVHMIESLLS